MIGTFIHTSSFTSGPLDPTINPGHIIIITIVVIIVVIVIVITVVVDIIIMGARTPWRSSRTSLLLLAFLLVPLGNCVWLDSSTAMSCYELHMKTWHLGEWHSDEVCIRTFLAYLQVVCMTYQGSNRVWLMQVKEVVGSKECLGRDLADFCTFLNSGQVV